MLNTDHLRNTAMLCTLEDQDDEQDTSIRAVIEASGALEISIDGYGTYDTEDGYGVPIYIEIYKGQLRVVLHPNINAQDPMIIDMEPARCSNRRAPPPIAKLLTRECTFAVGVQGGRWDEIEADVPQDVVGKEAMEAWFLRHLQTNWKGEPVSFATLMHEDSGDDDEEESED